MAVTEWRGTEGQREELVTAWRRHCATCQKDHPFGGLCAEHKALLADQRALDRLAFERHEAARWIDQEWRA